MEGVRCEGSEVWRELYLGCQERVKREVAMDRYLIAGSSSVMYSYIGCLPSCVLQITLLLYMSLQ